jgi:hypothetical protein
VDFNLRSVPPTPAEESELTCPLDHGSQRRSLGTMVFKAARRDVASHSFESTRRRLGDHKARQGDALPF